MGKKDGGFVVDIVFPPVHDPALPHISGPLLKAYLAARYPDVKVACIDLNQRFFATEVVGAQYESMLKSFRDRFRSTSTPADAVKVAVDFDAQIRRWCRDWQSNHPGHAISFRYYTGPIDRRDPGSVSAGAQDPSVFDPVFVEYLASSSADVIGIGISVEDQIVAAARLSALIRQMRPECRIVWGGNLVSRIYTKLYGDMAYLWDYVVVREGEEPFAEIVELLATGSDRTLTDPRTYDQSRIPTNSISRPFKQRAPLPITDLTSIAVPDFSDLPVDRYCSLEPMLPVLMSRKCYWGRCSFCTIHSAWDDSARKHDASWIYETIARQVDMYGIRHYRIVDEAAPPDVLESVCQMILESELKISFEIYAIAERRFRRESFVKLLGRAGCRQAYFGLESVDRKTLRAMGKGINQVDSYGEIFDLCARAGIHVYVYTLFGFPGKSAQAAEDATADYLIAELNIHTATISSFIPVTGSPFAEQNAEKLSHAENMTEDFSEYIGASGASMSVQSLGAGRAENALRRTLGSRPDLALTSLLNDEARFVLSASFGPRFAQATLGEDPSFVSSLIQETALNEALYERIDRTLPT